MKNFFEQHDYRNITIYVVHVIIVLSTAYLSKISNLFNFWFVLVLLFPLILVPASNIFKLYSYTINVRIIFPISVGIFFVTLYHVFPEFASDEQSSLSVYGVSNAGDTLDAALFKVNDLFKDAVTVLYAICVAFLLLKGLSDFDELKQVLYSEANEVRKISDFATYFMASGDPVKNYNSILALRCLLRDYLSNMLRGRKVVASADNAVVLQDSLLTVGELVPVDYNDRVALEEIMKGVGNLASLRAQRTVCIEKRMSPFIMTLIFVMSLTITLSFFGEANGQISIDYVYVFLLPTFYTSIFMTLLDLSSPFDGYWAIKTDALCGVLDHLKSQIDTMEQDKDLIARVQQASLEKENPSQSLDELAV
ncbi:MAG: hypothetical protein AAGF53_19350 [Pseudomonadota bacterium]